LKSLKIFLFCFFIFQTSFTLFYEEFFDSENLFPIFNWKIFHPRPDKIWTQYFVYINEVDGQTFDPSKDILDLKHLFPNVNIYTLTEKIHNLGLSFNNPDRQEFLDAINENLVRNHQQVNWVLVEKKFNVIQYYLNKDIISSQSLQHFLAKKTEGL